MNVTFRVYCQAYYQSSLEVPDGLSEAEVREYVKDHLADAPLGTLEYLPDSDELDDESEIVKIY